MLIWNISNKGNSLSLISPAYITPGKVLSAPVSIVLVQALFVDPKIGDCWVRLETLFMSSQSLTAAGCHKATPRWFPPLEFGYRWDFSHLGQVILIAFYPVTSPMVSGQLRSASLSVSQVPKPILFAVLSSLYLCFPSIQQGADGAHFTASHAGVSL